MFASNPGLLGSQNMPWIPAFSKDQQPQPGENANRPAHFTSGRKYSNVADADADEAEENSHEDEEEDSDEFVDVDDASDANKDQVSSAHLKGAGSIGHFRYSNTNKRPRLSTGSVSTPRSAGRPRRVDADLNSDDEIIYSMKERGYKDELVRDELIRQGRIRYVAKTISTRYGRIKRALEARETKDLDDNLSDWHDGDDELLQAAYAEVLPAIEEQRAALDRKMWSEVATTLKRHMSGKPRFSKHACRDRFTALQDGTAEPTLEQDPDQEGRLAKRAERERNRSIARAEASKHAELTAEERAKKDAEERRNREQRANKAADRAQRTAEKKRQRDSLRANREAEQEAKIAMLEAKEYEKVRKITFTEQEREAKKREAAAIKLERQRERQTQAELKKARNAAEKAEKAREKLRVAEEKLKKVQSEQNIKDIMKRRMGQALAESRTLSAGSKTRLYVSDCSEDEVSDLALKGSRASMAPPRSRWHPGTASTYHGSVIGDAPGPSRDRDQSMFSMSEADWTPSPSGAEETNSIEEPKFLRSEPGPPDPRATLNLDNLKALCHERKMPMAGSAEDLVARLADADNRMHINQLKAELKKRGVSTNGSKAELVYRSAACDAGHLTNAGRNAGQQSLAGVPMTGQKSRIGPYEDDRAGW